MSNFIYGRIISKEPKQVFYSKLDFSIIEVARNNNFALSFIDTLPTINTAKDVNFRISDNFMVKYCESFMEPIIYSADGKPLTKNIWEDLNKLQCLIREILKYDFVQKVELRFSYIEVDEEEYEILQSSVEEMKDLILNKYITDQAFPVANFVITR